MQICLNKNCPLFLLPNIRKPYRFDFQSDVVNLVPPEHSRRLGMQDIKINGRFMQKNPGQLSR
jgi:hypothetical protein